ncbi:MAG: nucleotidyltransferase family protein [Candidatus Omnitrophica bacterium]|nr:nucleotidyltransferase family protein [Candidatus Omnitrophota bacterium]
MKGDFKIKALILAAGYATRLYPLTKEFPKPLLKIKNRPIINYIANNLNGVKIIDEIFVVTNSKFIGKFKEWKRKFKSPKKISLINDRTKSNDDRLGAIGDLSFVLKNKAVKDDLLVIGGDNLFNGKLNDFVKFAQEKRPDITIGSYRLKDIKDASKYGVVKIDKEGKVFDFKEKPKRANSPFVAMCLYYIPKERFSFITHYMKIKKYKNDATGKYIGWLQGRTDVYCFVFKGLWYDIGDYKYLNAAKNNFA